MILVNSLAFHTMYFDHIYLHCPRIIPHLLPVYTTLCPPVSAAQIHFWVSKHPLKPVRSTRCHSLKVNGFPLSLELQKAYHSSTTEWTSCPPFHSMLVRVLYMLSQLLPICIFNFSVVTIIVPF